MFTLVSHVKTAEGTETRYLAVEELTGKQGDWVTDLENAHRFDSLEVVEAISRQVVDEDLITINDAIPGVESPQRSGVMTSAMMRLNQSNPKATAQLQVLDGDLQEVSGWKVYGTI